MVNPPLPCRETVLVVTPSKVTPTDIPVTIPVPENFLSQAALPSGMNSKRALAPCTYVVGSESVSSKFISMEAVNVPLPTR